MKKERFLPTLSFILHRTKKSYPLSREVFSLRAFNRVVVRLKFREKQNTLKVYALLFNI